MATSPKSPDRDARAAKPEETDGNTKPDRGAAEPKPKASVSQERFETERALEKGMDKDDQRASSTERKD